MKLEDLLNAAVQLEKRIETDRMLRACFSALWKEANAPQSSHVRKPASSAAASDKATLTLAFSKEFCDLLQSTARASGKTPSELLEESFAEYYLKHFGK